ncbi:XRE family transcriptional regulator [Fulvivirga sediminis]|uniref:Helix-turn-helix domain-containing protein n=1 Tax=Fulvivirga sediminis TaxID=2803949 RepID=A0A937F8C9_9BACT|nr:helix-turn-helix domain-containing protein [Fulvivirga sediminis]MBL3656160.1 helix-turn-helix domain-containing protein [Fulvivirga sediminis]
MSFIGKNIKKIRAVKKMSQSDFAQLFNLARPSVGAYEEGRTEPKIETLIQIAKHFELSIDTLLTKELTINELYKFDIFKKEFSREEKEAITDKDDVAEQTPFISLEKHLDYIVSFQNKDFINKLPAIHFPFTQHKKSRAFQINGNEMVVENQGIHHKDILLCLPTTIEDVEKGLLYVIITKNDILVRRFSRHNTSYVFKADNPAFDSLRVQANEILEIWKADAIFSKNLESPSRLEERVSTLEEQVKKLLTELG